MPPLLTMDYKRKTRLEMIEIALKEQAPKLYLDLKEKKKLGPFLRDTEKEMMGAYDQVENEAISKASKADGWESVQEAEMTLHQGWESILATYLEFQDPVTIESQREV